jgi:hypothetical protein
MEYSYGDIRFRETGEIRSPRRGEWYEDAGSPYLAKVTFSRFGFKILAPVGVNKA